MLVICNGSFKSGSSWLHAIVLEIFRIKNISISKIPDKYNPNHKSPTRILPNQLFKFLSHEDYTQLNYITKSHYFSSTILEASYSENVKFLFIERDIKDAVVSHFHHFINYRKKGLSFNTYFRFVGIFKAYEISLFNKRCRKNFNTDFIFSFKDLHSDFISSVLRLSDILGIIDISEDEILEIKENTSLEMMRARSKEGSSDYYPELESDSYKLFRKGVVGEWKNYYSKKNIELINRIIALTPPMYVRVGYFFIFTLRRKIGL